MEWSIQRVVLAALAAAVASVLLAAMIGAPNKSESALVEVVLHPDKDVGDIGGGDGTESPLSQPGGGRRVLLAAG